MAVPGSQQPCLWNSVMALLLLLPTLTTGLPCHHLRTCDNTLPWDALQLLQVMAPSPLQPCHLQQPPFFPDTLLHANLNPQQAAATALRILHHLFHTLSTNSTSHHWHTQPRNHLLNKLQHYIHHLHKCSPADTVLFKGPRNPLLTINKYFRDIHLFLRTHNHSACAWEHVRLEARASFQHVDTLIRQMK
ncbi:IFN protein, partial [Smithornis capensis]|nr:IFN protein [Smithornis capensis]